LVTYCATAIPVQLVVPAGAVRERPAGFTGTPMPKDEPMASNPPVGAYIDYVLPGGAFREVTLEIFDDKGARVRRYSSADAPPAIDPAKLRTAPEWFVTPSTLSTAPGMHRFVWPLRFAAPTALTNGRGIYADGVWAPPGNYKVALSVDGRKLVQPLTIVPDPRVNLPASAYEEQVALATQVVDTWAGVDGALDEADTLIKTLAERRKSSSGAAATAIDALRDDRAEIATTFDDLIKKGEAR